MASLPNSLKVDRLFSLTLSFWVATSLGSGVLASACAAAQGQTPPVAQVEAAADDTAAPTLEQPSELANGDDEDTGLAAEPPALQAEANDAPPAQPVPRTLDELIPDEAVANPDVWALAGAAPLPDAAMSESAADGSQAAAGLALADLDDEFDAALLALETPGQVASAAQIGQQLDEFALALPEPLESDAEGEAFAQLALPELEQSIELTEFALNDTITLAFPTDPAAFPEREEFTTRFRRLSALAQLGRGENTAPQVAARARADADLLNDILRAYGYYNGEVVRQLSGGRRAGGSSDGDNEGNGDGAAARVAAQQATVRFDIYPGPPYMVGAVDLGALDRFAETQRAPLREAFGIQPGDRLLSDKIIEEEAALGVALGETGYPFVQLGEPELLIDHAREEGDITVPITPGGRYAFGSITSSDPSFLPGKHLARIARFEPGEIYQKSLETDLRTAILATGLVSSVTITPREETPPTGDEPGAVALDVAFERGPLRTITGGIGYGTEDGFKLETVWEHRNILPPEGALRLRGIVGTREMVAAAGFKRNNFRGRDQALFFDVFASDINTVAVESRTLGVRGTFERLSNFIYQKEFSWQIGAEALITEERNRRVRLAPGAETPRRSFTIAGLFGSATIDRSNDFLDPTSGFRATLFLAPESSRAEGAQDFYLRAQLDAAAYRSVGERVVMAGRVRAATIQGADLNNVAPSRRLYGGGGASVRGYGFQGVGPRDEFGEATGGAALLEASIEARINTPFMDGAVQIVPFFDIGSVSQRSVPNFDFVRYAAGLGVRYKTTFGPIRVDVGVPLNRSEFDAPVVVFIGIGQAF